MNVVNYVKKHTNIDIMNFNKLVIYITKLDQDHLEYNVKYTLLKQEDGSYLDEKNKKYLKKENQLRNRFQYIQQSGYELENIAYTGNYEGKHYVADGNELEIEFN